MGSKTPNYNLNKPGKGKPDWDADINQNWDIIDQNLAGPAGIHQMGSDQHTPDTLSKLNSKITDANLDDSSSPRPPNAHASAHENGGSDKISLAGLTGESATPQPSKAHNLAGPEHNPDTLANLNSKLSDANLDDSSSPRPPISHTHTESDITDLDHNAGKIDGKPVSAPSPNTDDVLTFNGINWVPQAASKPTKEVFFHVPRTMADGKGNFDTNLVGGTGARRFVFHVPHDFTSLVECKVVGIPSSGAAGPDKDIDLYSDYGANGEAYNTHDESDTTSLYTIGTADTIWELDVSSVLNNISANDYVAVEVDHKGIGGGINYIGIRLRYN